MLLLTYRPAISFVSVSGFAQSNSVILAKVVSSGDLVSINTYNSVLNLRNAPCGQIVATIPSMGTGMVAQDIKNNTKMMCNGGNWQRCSLTTKLVGNCYCVGSSHKPSSVLGGCSTRPYIRIARCTARYGKINCSITTT